MPARQPPLVLVVVVATVVLENVMTEIPAHAARRVVWKAGRECANIIPKFSVGTENYPTGTLNASVCLGEGRSAWLVNNARRRSRSSSSAAAPADWNW